MLCKGKLVIIINMFILKGELHFMIQSLIQGLFAVNSALADAGTAAPAGTDSAQMSPAAGIIQLLIMIVPMILIFYFLLIRPQKKKDKQVKSMLDNLKVSDRICTIGGIYGTIVSIKDDTFTLAVGQDNVKLVIARWAIRNVEEITIENDGELLA